MDRINPIFRLIRPRASALCAAGGMLCLLLAGCVEPAPRTFNDFMEDQIAREGALVRCDMAGKEMQNDIECANARRADATIALQLERERNETLERESQRRIEELNQRILERERLAREAAREAVLAEREAYEALWRERLLGSEPAAGAADGAAALPQAAPGDEPGQASLEELSAEAN